MTVATLRGRIRLLALVVLATVASAQSWGLEFRGPEILKIGWSIGSLVASDVNGDGRTDLAVINNDRARIELLFQREPGVSSPARRPAGLERWQPVLEDARFDRRNISTTSRMYTLDVGDLNGDGRMDLAFTGSTEGLTVRYQDRKGGFDRQRHFDISEPATIYGTLAIEDLDADGRMDLAVLTRTELVIYRQTTDGELDGPEIHRLSEGCYALDVLDMDGDGLVDITYQLSGATESIRVRHGVGSGGFGPELDYRMSSSRGIVRPMPAADGRGSDFVRIQSDTGLLERLSLVSPEKGETALSNSRPRVFPYPTDGKAAAASALGDFDGNSLLDLAVADPRAARIWVTLQLRPGIFAAAEDFPALTGVRALIAVDRDGDGRHELVMASPKERTLAWTSLGDDGALGLPRVIDGEGKPQAVAAADFDADGQLDLVYASADKKVRKVILLPGSSSWTSGVEIEVGELETDPETLRVVDADADGRPDLALFAKHDDLRLLRNDGDGSFSEVVPESGFSRSLVADLEASSFTVGDVDADGVPEMIIADADHARGIRLGDGGELEVVAQFNARSSDAEIASAVVVGASKNALVALLEPTADRIHAVTQRRSGVWRFAEGLDLPAVDLVEARSVDLDATGTDDLVIFGSDRFIWIPVDRNEPALRTVTSWDCDLAGVEYQKLAVGDFDADGSAEVVAVDSRDSHVLEILKPGGDDDWQSLLHFTVFEVDPHYEGQRGGVRQPREIVIADLTNDGHVDLALVAHDRVLIYPQIP